MLQTVVAVEVVVVAAVAVAKELDWGKVIDVVGNVVIVISYRSFRQRKMLKKKVSSFDWMSLNQMSFEIGGGGSTW